MKRTASVLTVAIALGGVLWGFGASTQATSEPTATSGTSEPTGALSRQEYRLMISAARLVKRAAKHHNGQAALRNFAAACHVLQGAPTSLLQASYQECLSELSLFKSLLAFSDDSRACERALAHGDSSCLSGHLTDMATNARNAIATATAANHEADVRGIRGQCRDVVGASSRDLRSLSRFATAADRVTQSLQTGSVAKFRHAWRRFGSALRALTSGPNQDPLKQVRACHRA